MLALLLAAALLMGPVGTSLAQCVTEGGADHDPGPAPTEPVVSAVHMHDCSGTTPAADLDPAVHPDPRRAPSLAAALDLDAEGGSLVGASEFSPLVPTPPAAPRSRAPTSSLRSVRTVVLLV